MMGSTTGGQAALSRMIASRKAAITRSTFHERRTEEARRTRMLRAANDARLIPENAA